MLRRSNPRSVHAAAPSYAQVVEDTGTGTIFVAGQVGLTPEGVLAGADMASQTRQLLANVDAILAELGLRREHIARRQVFVTRMDEYFTDAVNGQVTEFFRDAPSTSTLVGVASLFQPGVSIEVELTLVRPRP